MITPEGIRKASRTALEAAEPYAMRGHVALGHDIAARAAHGAILQVLDLAEGRSKPFGAPGPPTESDREQLLGLAVAWLQGVRSMSAATITAGKMWEEARQAEQVRSEAEAIALEMTDDILKNLEMDQGDAEVPEPGSFRPGMQSWWRNIRDENENVNDVHLEPARLQAVPAPAETPARSTQGVAMITTLKNLPLNQDEADGIADRVHLALRNAHPEDKGVSTGGGVEPMAGNTMPDGMLSFVETGRYGPDGDWQVRHFVEVFGTGRQARARFDAFRENQDVPPTLRNAWIEWFQLDNGGGVFLQTDGALIHVKDHEAAVTLIMHTARGRSQGGSAVGPAPGDKLYPLEAPDDGPEGPVPLSCPHPRGTCPDHRDDAEQEVRQ